MNEPTELNERILEALAVAVEVTGASLTPPAIKIMVAKLQQHPEAAVLKAIDRAMEEIHGRLSLASIIERIRHDDGRPTAEEAWGQVGTNDEALTLVTTDEALQARGDVQVLMDEGDHSSALPACSAISPGAATGCTTTIHRRSLGRWRSPASSSRCGATRG